MQVILHGTRNRVAAVLHADVENYTGRMGVDPLATVAAIRAAMAIFDDGITGFGGTLLNRAGDSVLAEYPDAPSAIRSAIEVQRRLAGDQFVAGQADPIRFRIGIHLGPVIDDRGELYGDTVNVAARIQECAEAGGVMVSATVHEAIKSVDDLEFEDHGPQRLRNVPVPVRMYQVQVSQDGDFTRSSRRPLPRLTLPSIPSIVVLPFRNIGGDPAHDYLSDGVTEEVIGDLSRFRELFVIGRISSFAYKHRRADIGAVARELGVGYVLEGSLQVHKSRLRLQAQLIDARTEQIAWSERLDRDIEDLLEMQASLSRHIVGALLGHVERRESIRVFAEQTDSLPAYDCVLRGNAQLYRFTREGNHEARRLFELAVEIDYAYARAYALMSRTHNHDWRYHWSDDAKASLEMATDMARRAVSLDATDARAHAELGWVHLYRHDHGSALRAYETARMLNPNDADILADMAEVYTYRGECAVALDMITQAKRLNPHYPDVYLWNEGDALFGLRRYGDVVQTIGQMRDPGEGCRLLAASLAYLNRHEEASAQAAEVLRRQPGFSVDAWVDAQPDDNPEEREHFRRGLLLAGLK